MVTERKLDVHISQWIVQATARLLCTFAVLQGVVITFGEPARFGGTSFGVASSVPGSPATWGVFILLAGLLGIVASFIPSYLWVAISMFLGAFWCLNFGLTFIINAFMNEGSALTGIISYMILFIMFAMIGVVHLRSR